MWLFRTKTGFDFQRASRLFVKYETSLESRRFRRAERAIGKLFALALRWAEQDRSSSPDLDLSIKADECLHRSDWEGAESAFQEILNLPNGNAFVRTKAHSDLRSLFCLLNRFDVALEQAQAATAAAREADSEMLLAAAMQGEATCRLKRDELAHAEALIEETFSVLPQSKLYDHMRARTQILHAQWAFMFARHSIADDDLAAAMPALEPASHISTAVGIHSDLATWWSVRARLSSAAGDKTGAISAWESAVRESSLVASQPHANFVYSLAAGAFMLAGLSQALTANCDHREAEVVRIVCNDVISRIRLPPGVCFQEPR